MSGSARPRASRGICRASGRFRNYSIQDGLPGRDFTGWSACFRNSRGMLYFGGFAGAVELDPAALRDDSFRPPTVLTQLEVGGVPVEVGPRSPLQGGNWLYPGCSLVEPGYEFRARVCRARVPQSGDEPLSLSPRGAGPGLARGGQ